MPLYIGQNTIPENLGFLIKENVRPLGHKYIFSSKTCRKTADSQVLDYNVLLPIVNGVWTKQNSGLCTSCHDFCH